MSSDPFRLDGRVAFVTGALASLLGRSVAEVIDQAERTFTGTSVLWLGPSRF